MVRVEIPVVVSRVKDEALGIQSEDTEFARALIYTNYVCYILEQPDGSATVAMADGEELTTSLTYSEIKELLK